LQSLAEKPEGKGSLGINRSMRMENIKWKLKDILCDGVE
jgi:hypothetical protein